MSDEVNPFDVEDAPKEITAETFPANEEAVIDAPADVEQPEEIVADDVPPEIYDEDYWKLAEEVERFNTFTKKLGLPTLQIVQPSWCLPRKVNARFMTQQTMQQLVENVKRDGNLESVPLVMPARPEDIPTNRVDEDHPWFETLSGHHRVEGAEKAERKWIIVMVTYPESESEATAKQISHNAISGEDDTAVLKQMFESIDSLQDQMYSGMATEADSISIASLSVRVQPFEEFVLMFIPEDIENFDECMQMVDDYSMVKSGTTVRLAPKEVFNQFSEALRKVKKTENIKSNATALSMMCDLAIERLEQLTENSEEVKEGQDFEETLDEAIHSTEGPTDVDETNE